MSEQVIDCGETLGIADVGDLYATLLSSLAEGETVAFDCSKVERIDTAAIQMLYAYSKEIETQGKKINWSQPSDSFVKSVALLGLASAMNIEDNS